MASPAEDAYAAATNSRRWTLEELAGRLEQWLAGRLGVDRVTLADARYPVGAGTSSETVLTTARWESAAGTNERDLVFRMHPDRFQLFLEPDFSVQYRVLQALQGRVKVPEVLFVETDPDAVGLPFFVMEQLHGRVPVTSPPYSAAGWLFDARADQRRRVWQSAVEEMARIARLPVAEFSFLDRPGLGPSGLEQQVEYWRRSRDWVTDGNPPEVLVRYAAWLDEHLPEHRPDGFSWGDARPGNMLFGEDFELLGVLDWEQVNLGGIRQDLGWWLYFDHFNTTNRGLERLDGMGTRDETIALWESIVGEPAGDLTWYEVFSGYKVAILSTRTMALMGDPNPSAKGAAMALQRPSELTGIPIT